MANISRTQDNLNLLFEEQLEFLKHSCASFDNGFQGEVKRLAVAVRVLVHDTDRSTSLLTQSNKKSVKFLDTAVSYNDENVYSHSALVQTFFGGKGRGRLRPNLDYTPHSNWIGFDDWWNGVVLVDIKGHEFSRKDIVLFLANKEGGAHVDHEIDEKYHNLQQKDSMGWTTDFGDGRKITGEDHVPTTMRQIAHELIRSLDGTYTQSHPEEEKFGNVIHEISIVPKTSSTSERLPNLRKDRPMIGGKKAGRNDLCPCGSGNKFKRCCISK